MVSGKVETTGKDDPTDVKQSSLVICLDNSCQEAQFYRNGIQNGEPTSPHINESPTGLLSKDDIELLLTMFSSGTPYSLTILT